MKSRKNKNLLSSRNILGKQSSNEAKTNSLTINIPTLQQINRYLLENNIKVLEVDEEGRLVTKFKG